MDTFANNIKVCSSKYSTFNGKGNEIFDVTQIFGLQYLVPTMNRGNFMSHSKDKPDPLVSVSPRSLCSVFE